MHSLSKLLTRKLSLNIHKISRSQLNFSSRRHAGSSRPFALETSPTSSVNKKSKPSFQDDNDVGDETKLTMDLVQHLERTSLVHFDNEEALQRLEEAVQFASTLFEVDTTGVEPLTSVLEDESLYLREDNVEPTNRQDVLANASITEEDYFVAPPGNIPLDSTLLDNNR